MDLAYTAFQRAFLKETGLDLTSYKQRQMQRRIDQWMNRHGLNSYNDLIKLIQEDPEKREEFLGYLTINTSQFFRDKKVFDNIKDLILPQWQRQNIAPRIWSAGTSIGAEAYSMAILLQEARLHYSILATDIDEEALQQARSGFYREHQLQGVPPEVLKAYFTKEGDGYRVVESLQRGIIFRRHNLLEDPFGRAFDMILCRNVFIYFTWETQERLLQDFARALRREGYFISGSAEQMTDPGKHGLKRVAHCIYQLEK
ncbi:MAG: protein-glutamate O-methyltransferase CheR [Firmicutes bacterium]|nr:protein-glutamate O-methyltransferase CheR [Bacillota bacterium]